jgi:hypothetical protein
MIELLMTRLRNFIFNKFFLKINFFAIVILFLWACKDLQKSEVQMVYNHENIEMNKDQASKLIELPLQCVTQEYPNKLNQVIGDSTDLKSPKALHPTFYGCFDWHSAVHGHWSMVELLQLYPDLNQAESIKKVLQLHLTKNNIAKEIEYFQKEINKSYERMYGWAWLFKLSQALHEWDDPNGKILHANLQPLINVLKDKFESFVPKLIYPIRVGEHTNTAFALNMMHDYAKSLNDQELLNQIKAAALRYYQNDENCPLSWEPSGFDFLSPCLEEAVLMQKVLDKESFKSWINHFLPQLSKKDYSLETAKVSDRSDGKLVHLDGLNFSRAWNLFKLSKVEGFAHLQPIAVQHFNAAYPNLVGDGYEGGHWLGSFAVYAYLAQ